MIAALVGVLAGVVVLVGASAPASSKPPTATSAGCKDSALSEAHEETIFLGADIHCAPAAPAVTYSGSMFATMASSLRLVGHLDFDGKDQLSGTFDEVDLCSLPGGSDLPGAKLTYEAVVYVPGPTREFVDHDTLEPIHGLPPLLTGGSNPAHGTLVHAGQTISVHITATEPTDDGPQEGIHDIQLTGPDGLIKSQDYGTHPVACDTSRLRKTLTANYTVPDNPPAVIHLTAIAHDFVGHEATLSADFPTKANEWTGTFKLAVTAPCVETELGTVSFTVNGKGAVDGTTTGHYAEGSPCRGKFAPAGAFEGIVYGTSTAKQFELNFDMEDANNTPVNDGAVTVPLTSSTTASAIGIDQVDGYARTYSVKLKLAS
jgi:hypothetical protein